MEYAALVAVYDRLADTDSNNEKRDILAETFGNADPDMLTRLVTLVRGRLSPAHDRLRDIATYEGSGSQRRKVDGIVGLLADADPNEARYVARTALGHLRVGVGEGTIRDALAVAFLDESDRAVAAVERAYQVTNEFQVVAETARDRGRDGLVDLDIRLFRPVQVMLAEKAERLAEELTAAAVDGAVRCEYKYDGIRAQVHVGGDDVRLFTRRLEDVTAQFPDAVGAVEAGVEADEAILDGELVGYTPGTVVSDDREPVPFQELSRRPVISPAEMSSRCFAGTIISS